MTAVPEHPVTPVSPVTGFSHVQLRVADVAASQAWYTTVLGMEVLVELPDTVALRQRAARLVVVLSPAGALDLSTSPLDHLAFAVPDGPSLEAWADHLTVCGIRHDGVVLELGKPSLPLLDPDGNAVELVAPAPR
ncbi:MAG: VOC family protein [Acidimicrobiales bacterium]|jgi:catechol-2,3-dioxygenase|nr:VOC family protein [Acidimicrobiales bacterium]